MVPKDVFAAVKKALEHRYMPVILAVIAFAIFLPDINSGYILDDYIQWSILSSPSEIPAQLLATGLLYENPGSLSAALFHQFDFSRNKEEIKKSIDFGMLPWWTQGEMRARLWRPLTSFTHWLDYRLFPNSVSLMHAHSFLWFAAVVCVVAILYRRLIGPIWLASLAALMYLIDENSYFPTIFIANRNALTAIFFGVLALLAHHKWRTGNSLSAAIFSQVFLLLSLLSGEAGIATFAYLFAYAVAFEEGKLRRRLVSLVPAISVIVLWRIIYNALGYGVSNFGLYVDPVNNPVHYALAVLYRAPILLMGQLSWQSADLVMGASDTLKKQIWFFSIIFLSVTFVLLVPLLRKSRLARFWFIAMILSVLPFCATFPSSRTLIFTGIAAFGLIATFLGSLLNRENLIPKLKPCRIAAWALCVILLFVHLPMAAAGRAVSPRMASFFSNAIGAAMRIDSPESIENKDVVIVNSTNPLAMAYMPFVYAYEGKPLPRAMRALAPALRPMTIRRTGPQTLVLKSIGGDIFSCEQNISLHLVHLFRTFNELLRGNEFRYKVNDKVTLSRLTIEVTSVDEKNMPTEVSFTFDSSLDDPALRFYQFNWHGLYYSPFNIPAIGEETQIPGPSPFSLSDSMKYMSNILF
jgi:hypothetical protein